MDPAAIPPEVWEALCRRCGKCCTEKVEIEGVVYITKKPCRFLDRERKTCTAYPDRYRVEPDCASSLEGIPRMIFPADCPYTKGIPDYVAPRESWNDEDIDDAIREVLGEDAV